MNGIDDNDPVNLDSSSVTELGREAACQMDDCRSGDSLTPEFTPHGARCRTQERELLWCEFPPESAAGTAARR